MLYKLIKHRRPNIDKIYLYVKDPFELTYQLIINGRKKKYLQIIDNVYGSLENYNPIKKSKVLIVFDVMIADMETDKKIKSHSH